jgi:hypothetical protein
LFLSLLGLNVLLHDARGDYQEGRKRGLREREKEEEEEEEEGAKVARRAVSRHE